MELTKESWKTWQMYDFHDKLDLLPNVNLNWSLRLFIHLLGSVKYENNKHSRRGLHVWIEFCSLLCEATIRLDLVSRGETCCKIYFFRRFNLALWVIVMVSTTTCKNSTGIYGSCDRYLLSEKHCFFGNFIGAII